MKTMMIALLVAFAAPGVMAEESNQCVNYGIQVEVTGGDKDCSYQGGNAYMNYCDQRTGSGAGAGAGGPGQNDASAGATAGSSCDQKQNGGSEEGEGGGEPEPEEQGEESEESEETEDHTITQLTPNGVENSVDPEDLFAQGA